MILITIWVNLRLIVVANAYCFLRKYWEKISEFTTFITPEQAQKNLKIFEPLYRGESILQHEGQGLRKDGTQFWLSCNMMELRDDTGNILGITSTAVDITECKKAEDQLK